MPDTEVPSGQAAHFRLSFTADENALLNQALGAMDDLPGLIGVSTEPPDADGRTVLNVFTRRPSELKKLVVRLAKEWEE